MPNFSIMSDHELIDWIINFETVAWDNPERYGTNEVELNNLKVKQEDLQAKMAARKTAEEAFSAAVKAQQASRQIAEPVASNLSATIKLKSDVSEADKQALGIDLRKAPTFTAPSRPENLVANGFEDGRNTARWNRGDNKPGTVFIIECKTGDAADFVYLDSVTGTKYEHLGVTPGVRCVYRVKAKRNGEESTYSNEATVY